MKSKNEAGDGLHNFTEGVGIPDVIIRGNSDKQTGHNTEFMKLINKYCISDRTAEPYYPWKNLVNISQNISRTADKDCRTPFRKVTGDTPDISEWVDFEFYDLVWCWYQIEGELKLGRYIGVSHRILSRLLYWILTEKGDIISITTVHHITEDQVAKEQVQEEIHGYMSLLHKTIGQEEFVLYITGSNKILYPGQKFYEEMD